MPKPTSAFCIALAALILAGSSGSAQQTQAVAQVHLGNARTLLQGLPAGKFSADKDDNEDATEEVAKLRTQFDELVKAFDASPESPTEAGWKLKFSEIERTLARIIGGGSLVGTTKAGAAGTAVTTPQTGGTTTSDTAAVPAPTGTSGVAGASAGPTGTSGTTAAGDVTGDAATVAAAKVSTIGIKRLNPDVRRQLEMFRTEIELFYVAPVAERPAGAR